MGSAFSTMSADPRAPNNAQSDQRATSTGLDAGEQVESTSHEVANLRAAVLKSALQKRRKGKASALDKEDGEISEGDDGQAYSKNETAESPPEGDSPPVPFGATRGQSISASAPHSQEAGIKRSTVVTISDNAGQVKRRTLSSSGTNTGLEEDESQYLEIIRNLLHDGVAPDTLIDNGAPSRFVTRVCEEIVAGSRTRKSLWNQTRSPVEDGSETANTGLRDGSSQTGSETPNSTSSIEVAVYSVRRASGSESENEAAVERLTAPPGPSRRPSIPRIIPSSSWTPSPSQIPASSGAVRIETYRPPTRPSSTVSTPVASSPFKLTQPAMLPSPGIPPYPPPPAPQQHKRQKRHRDYDSVSDNMTLLNYGDEDPAHSSAAAAPKVVQSATPSSVLALPSPSAPGSFEEDRGPKSHEAQTLSSANDHGSLISVASPSVPSRSRNGPPAADIAEVRRKALESMRQSMRKRKSPVSLAVPANSAPDTTAEEAVPPPHAVKGSTAEMPMDIDEEEPEEGEIADTPAASVASPPATNAAPTAPVIVTATSLRRAASSRGVKRPLAEDLNDSCDRPKTIARSTLNRRGFGGPQKSSRLVLCLDEDSDNESSSDEEAAQPRVNVPRIVIPAPFPEPDTAALLAAKAESIRKLKEQIAARLLAKKSSLSTPATSVPGSPAPTDDVRRVKEAAAAAENVGIEGLASDVVEAAVLAAAEEQKQSDVAGSHRKGQGKGKAKGKGKTVSQGSGEEVAEPSLKRRLPSRAQQASEDADMVDASFSAGNSTALQATASQSQHSNFHAYRPLLSSYPQLAASSLDLLPQHEERKQTLDVDWTLVSSIMLTSRLQEDPAASICRSEAAGGSCANPGCEDVHILRSEPTDADIITYATRLIALQGFALSESEDASNALKQAKADVTQTFMDNTNTDSQQWANATTLTALVEITAQRLRAR